MSHAEQVADQRVAVVIVNWNGWIQCIECLDALFAQLHENFHVFVVDNESGDRSVERIIAWCNSPLPDPAWRRHSGVDRLTDRPGMQRVSHRLFEHAGEVPPAAGDCRLTLVRSGGNLGFAGGCNVGIVSAGLANFEYFWFLNADAVVERRALVELLVRAERQADIGMVGSVVRYYDSPDRVQAMGGARLDRSNGNSLHVGEGAHIDDVPCDASVVERQLDYIMGASMLVSRRYIAEVGLMEEDYFLYFEDADWAMRGSGRFSLGFAPRSHVFHKWGGSSHKAASLVSERYYYRNRLRFVMRFLPGRLAAAKRAMFEQLLRHLMRGRWMKARVVLSTLINARAITLDVRRKN